MSEWRILEELVNVIFHDGHIEQMTLGHLRKLPYTHEDVTEYGDNVRTFALQFSTEG